MKKKINISNWKRFKLYDDYLFKIESGNKFDKSKMSIINPEINFISRSNNNNGISCVVDRIENVEPYKAGNMTIALGGEYLGSCFIQQNDFYTSQNVNVLIPKWNMSDNMKKFISVIIFKESRTYYKAFEDELNRHITTDFSILLPIDDKGTPDWEYMEQYMKVIEEKAQNKINIFSSIKGNQNKVNISKFKLFFVETLFDIRPTRAYKMTNATLLDGGENPVLANSAYNNGVGGYSSQEITEKGNIITFSDTVDANTIFYQENDFIGYSHIQGMYPINEYANNWSKYSLLYFISIFKTRAKIKGFDYGNKFRRDTALKLDVLLPVKDNGKIDFEYMEQYMKAIEEKAKKEIKILQKL
ncbi:restriction endonuclease subunit S [uncultured Fusobacterium sp.]|uniref:restriction endonuclease subunit S n=1 Tax=uncultured Fusobacterium sp. TaxID=159267 RepID=UPI00260FB326|nr:restriction endonuclease subunit S [uncultured Fusobacterium sp.]